MNLLRRRQDLLSLALLGAVAVLLFLTAPRDGEFWWSEAPRNALNGAFILDMLRGSLVSDPVGAAIDYYYHYRKGDKAPN